MKFNANFHSDSAKTQKNRTTIYFTGFPDFRNKQARKTIYFISFRGFDIKKGTQQLTSQFQ